MAAAGKSSEGTSADSFLLACRFFDRECAGYLAADDLEEIAFMSSDGISREPPTQLQHCFIFKSLDKAVNGCHDCQVVVQTL